MTTPTPEQIREQIALAEEAGRRKRNLKLGIDPAMEKTDKPIYDSPNNRVRAAAAAEDHISNTAAAVASLKAEERERCAKVVDAWASRPGSLFEQELHKLATALRAMKDEPVVEEWPHLNVAIESKP